MRLIRGRHNFRASDRGAVLTIGVFDGVHRGHQALIDHTRALASELRAPSMVMTFEPYPREFFSKSDPPARLSTLREKCVLLRRTGIDFVLALKFDQRLRKLSPVSFAQEVLSEEIGAKAVLVGEDFRFGHRGAGDFMMLRTLGREYGFAVYPEANHDTADGQRISSSRVREALLHGDLARAKMLLGRDYALSGRVRHGRKLGREIGFPTANIGLGRQRVAVRGIFATRVHGVGPDPVMGVASVGTRPTVDGKEMLLEVYLPDRDVDLYGRVLTVDLLARIRDEMRFDSLAELKRWIADDVLWTRNYFADHQQILALTES